MRPAPLGLLALGALLVGCGTAEPTGGGRTILLVSLDSVRADALTFLDPEVSPNLTALAADGTRFTSAWAGSSWTLPTHSSIFTGMPPVLHGVEYDDIAIDPGHQTLTEALDEAGWTTAGWWTGWYLAGEYGFARGFDIYQNAMSGGKAIEAAYQEAVARGDHMAAAEINGRRGIASHQQITSPNVVEALERTVGAVDREEDLFLFVHLFDPHYDYIPPAPYDTAFDPDYTGTMDGRDFYLNPAIYDAAAEPPRRRISDRDLQHVEALYQGEIAYTEAEVGRMLEALDEVGRLDEALVVVLADHGEEFFEHGNRGHRQGLHDEVLHVPLLIRPPLGSGAVAPSVGAMVGLQDVMPTILEHAGLEAPRSVVGRSLLPAVRGARLEDEPQLASLVQFDPTSGHLFVESIRTRERKLIRYLALDSERRLEVLSGQLFELSTDPGELRAQRSPTGQRDDPLWIEFEARLDELRRVYGELGPAPRATRGTAIAEVFASDLGGLGYADGAAGLQSISLSLPWPPGPRPRPTEAP